MTAQARIELLTEEQAAEDAVRERMIAAESRNSPEPRADDGAQVIRKAANDG
jgi:hypothetical protein